MTAHGQGPRQMPRAPALPESAAESTRPLSAAKQHAGRQTMGARATRIVCALWYVWWTERIVDVGESEPRGAVEGDGTTA